MTKIRNQLSWKKLLEHLSENAAAAICVMKRFSVT